MRLPCENFAQRRLFSQSESSIAVFIFIAPIAIKLSSTAKSTAFAVSVILSSSKSVVNSQSLSLAESPVLDPISVMPSSLHPIRLMNLEGDRYIIANAVDMFEYDESGGIRTMCTYLNR